MKVVDLKIPISFVFKLFQVSMEDFEINQSQITVDLFSLFSLHFLSLVPTSTLSPCPGHGRVEADHLYAAA
jgi:hypothetical protein